MINNTKNVNIKKEMCLQYGLTKKAVPIMKKQKKKKNIVKPSINKI